MTAFKVCMMEYKCMGFSVSVDIISIHITAITQGLLEGFKSDLYGSKIFIFYVKQNNINFKQMWNVGLPILIPRATTKKQYKLIQPKGNR